MDREEIIKAIAQQASNCRGIIINQTVFIERMIDEFLCGYFCEDPIKKQELMELHLGDKLPFEVKRNLFSQILQKHYPDFLIKHPKLIKEIISLIEERNIFAHYLLDTSDQGIEAIQKEVPQIGFIRFYKKTTTLWYTLEEVSTIVNRLKECAYIIMELLPQNEEPTYDEQDSV